MKTKLHLTAGFLALFVAAAVWAFPDSPPSKKSGAPGEGTCQDCHNDFSLFPAGGHLTLSSIPAQFSPGQTYSGTVTLASNGSAIWGFELSIKDTLQSQAGTLTVTDAAHTQSFTGTMGGKIITYLAQTAGGNFQGQSGPVSWNFNWTAPSASQPKATFYIAALAGNDDGGTSGDSVFTLSFASTATSTDVDDSKERLPLHFALEQNYPNPFNAGTMIPLELPKNGAAYELSIYNMAGQRLRRFSGTASGSNSIFWDARDQVGRPVASGIYLYTLSSGPQRISRKMILVK